MSATMNNAGFFFCGIALPLAAMITGFILWRNPLGINNGFGFRTKLSKSSDEAWYFAQKYSGRLMVCVSVPLLAVSALVCGISAALGVGSDGKFGVLLLLVLTGIIAIAAVNAVTDQKLKTSFKAAPHKDCALIAQSDFSSDCINPTQEYWRISRRICAR